ARRHHRDKSPLPHRWWEKQRTSGRMERSWTAAPTEGRFIGLERRQRDVTPNFLPVRIFLVVSIAYDPMHGSSMRKFSESSDALRHDLSVRGCHSRNMGRQSSSA